jgi:hypothetical protein
MFSWNRNRSATDPDGVRSSNRPPSRQTADGIGHRIRPNTAEVGTDAWVVFKAICDVVRDGKDPGRYCTEKRCDLIRNMQCLDGKTVDVPYIIDCYNWANDCNDRVTAGLNPLSQSPSHSTPAELIATGLNWPGDESLGMPPRPFRSTAPSEGTVESHAQSSLAISVLVRSYHDLGHLLARPSS